MGLLSRLKQISTGKLLAFLDDSSHPEQLVPQLIEELQSQQLAVRNAEGKSVAAVRSAQKKLEATLGRAIRMQRGAELALKNGDDQTAREALREQIRIEKEVPSLQDRVAKVQQILNATRAQKIDLRRQIASVKERGELIRYQLQSTQSPALPRKESSLLKKVALLEENLSNEQLLSEARLEIHQSRSLDERLIDLERAAEISRRLAQLQEKKLEEK